MVHGRTFSAGRSDLTANRFANKGYQYADYNSVQQFPTLINNHVKPKSIDTPLMLIFMMEQGACRQYFGLQRLQMLALCILMSISIII